MNVVKQFKLITPLPGSSQAQLVSAQIRDGWAYRTELPLHRENDTAITAVLFERTVVVPVQGQGAMSDTDDWWTRVV